MQKTGRGYLRRAPGKETSAHASAGPTQEEITPTENRDSLFGGTTTQHMSALLLASNLAAVESADTDAACVHGTRAVQVQPPLNGSTGNSQNHGCESPHAIISVPSRLFLTFAEMEVETGELL